MIFVKKFFLKLNYFNYNSCNSYNSYNSYNSCKFTLVTCVYNLFYVELD